MMARALIVVPLALMGCDMSVDPIVAADRCEARAQAAQAPSANVTVGTNSETGGFGRGNVSISSDFLRGLDPEQVYQRCVLELTGQAPVRPPVLRDL